MLRRCGHWTASRETDSGRESRTDNRVIGYRIQPCALLACETLKMAFKRRLLVFAASMANCGLGLGLLGFTLESREASHLWRDA